MNDDRSRFITDDTAGRESQSLGVTIGIGEALQKIALWLKEVA